MKKLKSKIPSKIAESEIEVFNEISFAYVLSFHSPDELKITYEKVCTFYKLLV